MRVSDLKVAELFSNLFPVDGHVLEAIVEHMAENGYDPSQPIVVWGDRGIVIDGHTRLEAARQAGIEDVSVSLKDFVDEDAALEYAIHNQRDRRNMTDADIVRCIEALDKRKRQGERTDLASSDAKLGGAGKSAKKTANVVGTSERKVEKARTVLEHGDEATKQAVKSGDKSINRAYQETQQRRRLAEQAPGPKSKSVFNETNDSIEWAKRTWNPVTGCKHDCSFCYARDIANRFTGHFEPELHESRLAAPKNTPLPKSDENGNRNVFVCSMADLFGAWVDPEWIAKVLGAVRESPEWNYIFLTKNPKRLLEVEWPDNAWVGTTVDVQSRVKPAQKAFRGLEAKVRFLSVEPMREKLVFGDLSMFDWVIIGGQSKTTGEPAMQPEWEWVESLMVEARKFGCKIYFKPNLEVRPKEYPSCGQRVLPLGQ